MKHCPKCNTLHIKTGTFCSRSCANSRIWTDEDKLKKSIAAKESERVKLVSESRKIPKHLRKSTRKCATNTYLNETPFNELGRDSKRKKVIIEQESRCNRCNISEWLEQPITLELEHKDGNNKNDERANLECLCPNCHSLTPTWRGRNIPIKRVSDEKLRKALREQKNIRQALLVVGLTPKGNNYVRASRLKDE